MLTRFLFLMAFSLLPFLVFTQEGDGSLETSNDSKPTIFQYLYAETEVPKIILTADLERIIENKFSEEEVKGRLEILNGGQKEGWKVKVKTRGKSRRRICYMPPLRLQFSKKELKAKGIRKKFNDLKLVSYCKDQDNYEKIVLREYLAYKMYNLLTDYSFKVQLVDIEYRDSLARMEPILRHGFFIENTDEMAKRLNAKEERSYELKRKTLDHHQYDIFAIFQYMISNTDWKINVLHNAKVIADKDTKVCYPIPYDFDFSGFVNALYAIPNPDFPQTHVRERYYMGDCKSANELKPVREHYISKKEEILSCENSGALSKKDCKRAKKFLKSFYKIMESDKKFKRKCLR